MDYEKNMGKSWAWPGASIPIPTKNRGGGVFLRMYQNCYHQKCCF